MGSYWYHEDTQAFFDDLDHYRMIKAMCRLSCTVCDKRDEQLNDGSKRRGKFRNVEQLKGHLFHQHKLVMCSLCLEGRKVFICEQKLYTRAQLNRHLNTGDSAVDGNESERGGFMGHPFCEFCKTPFYGDNELYSHMSTEHYTCHICQRKHPGQYEYYKNYDDLEIHFRCEHFLCEDEACLAKKFVVFQSESEMKRHNALEHGGRMSRSKRNAVLQIPTSFRYQRSNEHDRHRGRRQTFRRDHVDNQLPQPSNFDIANLESEYHDPVSSSSSAPVISDNGDTSDIDPLVQPFESLTTSDGEPPLKYLQAVSQNRALQESSFPPLAMGQPISQQKARNDSESLQVHTMAAHIRRQNDRNITIPKSTQEWPGASQGLSAAQSWPSVNNASPALSISQTKPLIGNRPGPSDYASSVQAGPEALDSSSYRKLFDSNKSNHSVSGPSIVQSRSFDPSNSDFPPATPMQKFSMRSHPTVNVEDVQTANKSLVERIRAALKFDEGKYTTFKNISGEYRQGLIGSQKYLACVQEYGLTELIYDLARLLPDPQKQKELVDTYEISMRVLQNNDWGNGSIRMKNGKGSKKAKGKQVESEDGKSKDNLADTVLSTVRKLQSSQSFQEEEVEVLTKDGYRPGKTYSNATGSGSKASLISASQCVPKLSSQSNSSAGGESSGNDFRGSKQGKKGSKSLTARLGDGSVAALLNPRSSGPDLDLDPYPVDGNKGLPVSGVWRNGGGQRLKGVARDARK